MCETDDFGGFEIENRMTRRRFGYLAMGASLVALSPWPALAGSTKGRDVDIATPAGTADAYFVHPLQGRHPGIVIWPDIFGLRSAFKQMATRLAEAGYAVLVVNPFYRSRRAPTAPERADFNDPAVRQSLMALRATLTPDAIQVDAGAFVTFLDQQSAVDAKRKIGAAGYCMGGPIVMRMAAFLPERVAALASFHGGGLVTDQADSPHHLIPRMKASVLIAVAENDDAKEPTTKEVLRKAFQKAKRPAEIEVYAGTKHGWCPTDSPVYDPVQAEKAWGRLLVLFKYSLSA